MAPELARLGKSVIPFPVSFSGLHVPRLGWEVMLTGVVSQSACEERLSLCLVCILGKQKIKSEDRHAF